MNYLRSQNGIILTQNCSKFWLLVNFSLLFFFFSNTISVNFWFEPSNSSKDDGVKTPEELNDTSIETDKDESLKEKTPEGDNNGSTEAEKTTQEDLEESNNSEQAIENKEDIKESEIKSDSNKERKDGESEREKEENEQGEEEEAEIELSAAKYLTLLREAEMLLYRGTRSHEKVKYLSYCLFVC